MKIKKFLYNKSGSAWTNSQGKFANKVVTVTRNIKESCNE